MEIRADMHVHVAKNTHQHLQTHITPGGGPVLPHARRAVLPRAPDPATAQRLSELCSAGPLFPSPIRGETSWTPGLRAAEARG